MDILLYDNWERRIRAFEPVREDWVGMYCCGPTVYDYAHIGNLRTYLFEDILRRVLELNGYNVRHVVNITDVGHLLSDADDGEDKMERRSRHLGESAWVIAQRFTEAFVGDLKSLNIVEPEVWCKATDHIAEQIEFIAALERKGYTYKTSDGVYFDTSKQEGYGYLARIDKGGLEGGKRVSLGEKRNTTDFALWKFSPVEQIRQMEWDSPWGKGFPGWHIECSAMSSKYLHSWFDIHCGGEDHISIHHTNEIAQNQACHGTRLANFWMHGYFLQVDANKMSKSRGKFLRLQTLIDDGIDPLAYRYLCLAAHYRSHLNFSWDALLAAQTALGRLREVYYSWPAGGVPDAHFVEQFFSEVNHDLDTPKAMALTWEVAKSSLSSATRRATIDLFERVLGLRLADWAPREEAPLPDEVRVLLEKRKQSRESKNWKDADALRAEINELGYMIEDLPDGMVVKRHSEGMKKS